MTWQVFIFASVVLTSAATLLQRVLLKDEKSDPVSFSIFFQLLTGLLIGAFGLFFADMSFPSQWSGIWFNLILMTVLYALGNVFIFKALKLIEASKFTVIFASRALFTTLASTVLLQEQTFGQLIAVAFSDTVLQSKGGDERAKYARSDGPFKDAPAIPGHESATGCRVR